MATLNLNDIVKVALTWDVNQSTIAQIVWHYKASAGSGEDSEDVLTKINTDIGTAWLNIDQDVSNTVVANLWEMWLWDSVAGEFNSIETKNPTLLDGVSAGQPVAHGTSAVVRFFTDRGKSQGRKFIPGSGVTLLQSQLWSAAYVTNLALFGAAFDNSIVQGAMTFSPGNFERATGTLRPWINLAQANTIPGYQRRRKPGVGI